MSIIKSVKVKQADDSFNTIPIGADSKNVSYNNSTVEAGLNAISLTQENEKVILTKPDGTTDTIEANADGVPVNTVMGFDGEEVPEGYSDRPDFINTLIDIIYPVGSFYWNVDIKKDPKIILGIGQWELVKGKFLLTASELYKTGSTGGVDKHVITTSDLPSHYHQVTYGKANTVTQATTLTAAQSGLPNHRHDTAADCNDGNGAVLKWNNRKGYGYQVDGISFGADSCYALTSLHTSYTGGSSASQGHTHNLTVTNTTVNTTAVGGSNLELNNMPPYEVAYCWKRIS